MTALMLVLSGCGGSGTAGLPAPGTPAANAPDALSRAAAPTATAAGTLYFSDISHVYAIPLNATGSTAVQRTITPHPNQSHLIRHIGVSGDGTLDVMDTFSAANSTTLQCRVIVEPADANGSPAAQTYFCDGSHAGQAGTAGANASGGFDILSHDTTIGKDVLHRFGTDGSTPINSMTLPFAGGIMTTDRGGHDYISNNAGHLLMYKSSTTDPTKPQVDFVLPNAAGAYALAVSPVDRTLYASGGSSIYAFATGTTTPARTIGPFGGLTIYALAVDSQGNLYATFHPSSGPDFIRVYDSSANGKPAPLRRIDPTGATGTAFNGIAVSE